MVANRPYVVDASYHALRCRKIDIVTIQNLKSVPRYQWP